MRINIQVQKYNLPCCGRIAVKDTEKNNKQIKSVGACTELSDISVFRMCLYNVAADTTLS